MHTYLAPWEWNTGLTGFWEAPGVGAVGLLDARTWEQQGQQGGEAGFGIFTYSDEQDLKSGVYLGPALDVELSNKDLAEVVAMLNLKETPWAIVNELIWQIFTLQADPTGITASKPVRGRFGEDVTLKLGGQVIRAEPFGGEHYDRTLAVFQADYIEAKAGGEDPEVLKKWAGANTLALRGSLDEADVREVLPEGHKDDGAKKPESSFTEAWPTVQAALATGQDQAWTETAQNINVESIDGANRAIGMVNGLHCYARCETALSSADHSHEAIIRYDNVTVDFNKRPRVCNRFAAAANTFMSGEYMNHAGVGRVELWKTVTGSDTRLTYVEPGSPPSADTDYTVKTLSSASAHSVYLAGGVQVNAFSDTAITGGVRIGIDCYQDAKCCTWRGHVAADNVADAVTPRPRFVGQAVKRAAYY